MLVDLALTVPPEMRPELGGLGLRDSWGVAGDFQKVHANSVLT